ncbi:pyruvate kinase [Pasteurellaceae bacterium HPA106]|uniref:pyruvate kinase n=1 Tax=Spirabiliibacterium pneumoniae TaxID=221400 RepID=UPI001AAD4BD6|nr:pyruvate kinase [Spirabiliibacterium pneumoniae]MBE2897047.1 pyruvate kinase [Spirabiliibacterium pneumoniae]
MSKNTTYWHMQMHPVQDHEFVKKIPFILENNGFIGIGDWAEGISQIANFSERMQVNDVVAIRNGANLIALVQIVGGMYKVEDDKSDCDWIVYRRPIRVLDWAIEPKTIPATRGTLVVCSDAEAETTQVIKTWYEDVKRSFIERNISLTV